ncbi:hypothetical protein [Haloferax sp. DFSO60]|uniref:hypothetical protein n=1 Tax=Haloferax sp. DFSO60 TaxID=3388652 RepID=UPI00397CDAE3
MASKLTARVDRWLDQVFFAGWEISVLVIPTLWFLIFAEPPEAVSLSGITALITSSAAVGTFRGGYIDTGSWPRPGHLPSLPARSAYYSLVVGGSAMLGAMAQVELGSFWVGIVIPTVATILSLALVPRVLAQLQRVARVAV